MATAKKKTPAATSIPDIVNQGNQSAEIKPKAKKATSAAKAKDTENAAVKKSATPKRKITLQASTPATTGVETTPPVVDNQKKTLKKAAEPATKTATTTDAATGLQIHFFLRFYTNPGQNLFITGSHPLLGANDLDKALPLQYYNPEGWAVRLDLPAGDIPDEDISYNYVLKNADGSVSFDWGNDKQLPFSQYKSGQLYLVDAWNHPGYFENVFYTVPFKNVFFKDNYIASKPGSSKLFTHTFRIKAPLLTKGQVPCIVGNNGALGKWDTSSPILLGREAQEDVWRVQLNLSGAIFPLVYKYGVYDTVAKKFIRYEDGPNRLLNDAIAPAKQTIVNDGFMVLPDTTWKGAGVAIPVFSLKSAGSFGVGEFSDLNLLTDWAKKVGLKLIQILPINDTTATHSWVDSYPYAAISAFALHPMYLNLDKVVSDSNRQLLHELSIERQRLNKLDTVDYEAVNKIKWHILREIYPSQKAATFKSAGYKNFFTNNSHWLVPYAAFCFLRDKYNTADFNQWPQHKTYLAEDVEALTKSKENEDAVAIHYFIQYHLHVQLKEATDYAHSQGVVVKGDIPIGIYRYGADAWQQPGLYHIDVQAGAPPDDFAITGQNWGFPTYNWARMKQDGFAWWKQRFAQMSYYFDAFRIDHILGFFRIWSIPIESVEGIMGHFEPAIPIHINEFSEKGIWFDYLRYTLPFINDQILNDNFGEQQDAVRSDFLKYDGFGSYQFKPEYATQRKLEQYFSRQENNEHNRWLKQSLYNLLSNVILFEVKGSEGTQFHFRFGVDATSSFKSLEAGTQYQLRELYINYFFRRQDVFWKQEALQKLPALKRVTNMLVCGEDLGMVPACVPDVMKQLGLLSLEIQRMPKDPASQFFHPNDAPYLSVVTPSTHDMSTIRGWWEEDRVQIQQFYNKELGLPGTAPHFCEADINKAIVLQHLYSPAMWSIFQLQDILGIDKTIRRDNPHEERINIPAIPQYYWRYRMHLLLEQLLDAENYNAALSTYIRDSGR